MKLNNFGWILAVGMVAAMCASGFQSQGNKLGVVNMATVFQTSDMFANKQNDLKVMSETRSDILAFLQAYPTITAPQAQRFRDLSLKPEPTGAEKTELEKLKADVMAGDKAFKALQTKAKPTPAEINQLKNYNAQTQQTATLFDTWGQEFKTQIADQEDSYRADVLTKASGAVQALAKKQGYTLIFTSDIVPYASNDVTPDTLKVMNAKK
jgi:Skp family chaperone for outer membrane proteins